MDLAARKYRFIESFMKLTSLKKLRRLEEVLLSEVDEEEIVAHTAGGEPLSREEYVKRIKEADEAIDRGEYLSHEDIKKEVRSWKK